MSGAYYRGISAITGETGRWDLSERWDDVAPLLDLRPDDVVLDVGCAEALLTFNVAAQVRQVTAFDVDPARVESAERLRVVRQITNVTLFTGSIVAQAFDERSFDVVLFLGVLHHLPVEHQLPSVAKCLRAAKRQVAIRTSIGHAPNFHVLRDIQRVAASEGFEVLCFAQASPRGGNVMLANRLGAGARSPVDARPLISP